MTAAILFFCFLLFLVFPDIVSGGAAEGLLIWYRSVFPVLFPCAVLSGVLVKTGAAKTVARAFYPFLGRIFSLSISGTYALLCGCLCGYPMGAAVTAQLRRENAVSSQEASYLMTFVNLPGPSFLTGFLISRCYPNAFLPAWSLPLGFFLTAFLISLVTRRFFSRPFSPNDGEKRTSANTRLPAALSDSMEDAMCAQLKICSCMVFYSAVSALLSEALRPLQTFIPEFYLCIIGSIPEITSGIRRLSDCSDSAVSFCAACALCAFGGLSVAAQTYAVTNDSTKARQPLGGYLACKILSGILVFALLFGLYTLC